MFESTNANLYAGLASAIFIGFSIHALNERADGLVDRLLFKKELAAEARLRQFAAALLYANSESTVSDVLVNEPVSTLGLSSCALFVFSAERNAYVRTSAIGWPEEAIDDIACDAPAVALLHSTTEGLDPKMLGLTGVPAGIQEPAYALPVKARGELFAIVLYGAHTDGTHLTNEERELLTLLTANAAAAFDHIEVVRARRELETLRLERGMPAAGT
jgi:GAF domain-containing protein